MSEYYVLDGKKPRRVSDVMEWAKSFEKSDRKVAYTELGDGAYVSTVFLGLNHQWGDGPPLIFESLVFNGPRDGDMERCSTWEQAEK